MVVKFLKIFFQNQKGQGLIEFLLFLPLMLMMYSVTLALSGSINASINQQKVARGFFYYRMQNNSTIPKPRRGGEAEPSQSWSAFGSQIIGWSERLDGDQPLAPCYELNLPFSGREGDTCEGNYSDPTTQFIRVMTVYGVCGASYFKNEARNNVAYPLSSRDVNDIQHCTISN